VQAMNGGVDSRNEETDVEDDVEESIDSEDTVVLSEDAADLDTVGDNTADINIEKLVAKIEAGDGDDHQKEIHRKLEELEEKRRVEAELDSTFNFNLDEDV
jgi:hypothetical protein